MKLNSTDIDVIESLIDHANDGFSDACGSDYSLDIIVSDVNGECLGVVVYDPDIQAYALDTSLIGKVVTARGN